MDLLESLSGAPWVIAARTYGNSHATLIGLLVNWWITAAPDRRWALEGGPSFGYREKGLGGGLCDALLGEGEVVRGILEVEGTRGKETATKIGRFFAAELDFYSTLEFGVLLLYAYYPTGRGTARTLPPARSAETIEEILRVSALYPAKSIVVIALDKVYERPASGIRQRSEYYFGRTSLVTGYLFENGREVGERVLFTER